MNEIKVIVADRNMEPEYQQGDRLTCDPDIDMRPGDVVVANLRRRTLVGHYGEESGGVIRIAFRNGASVAAKAEDFDGIYCVAQMERSVRCKIIVGDTTIHYNRITGEVLEADWSVCEELVRRGVLRRPMTPGSEPQKYFVNAAN